MNRRSFLASSLAGIAGRDLYGRPNSYADEMPDMLVGWMSDRLKTLAKRWDAERESLTKPAQIEARNRFVRQKLGEMIHGTPERTPLKAVVTANRKRSGYRVENVMFQSRPDFWVTGNLYIPEGEGPFPAIISPCGHYPLARMDASYQFAYMNLVKAGFIVLAYDPIGQGERRQYWDPRTGRTDVAKGSTYEHSMPGQLLLLMGEDLTQYHMWDGIRAIDYLLTRPEVDSQRIGCAGHSGGGTMTMFISAFDERVRCAVVNEGGTGHRWPSRVPNTRFGPSDVEQNLFPSALYGIDLCDILTSIAPRPLLTLIEEYNPHFDSAAAHIRRRYQQLDVPDHFGTDEATDPHAWTMKLRLATTNWFSRWFYNRPGPAREPDLEPEKPEDLFCVPGGSLKAAKKGQSIWTLIQAKGAKLPPRRSTPPGREEIAKLLRYRKCNDPLAIRHLVDTPRRGYRVEKVEFLSEPGIYIPAWVFVPESPNKRPVTLYIDEQGKEKNGAEFGLYEHLARKGHTIIAADVRGIGGTAPRQTGRGTGDFAHLFSVDVALTYMSWFMDECLFGERVADVIRSVDYAASRNDLQHEGLRVVGMGAGALWALYAAALDPRIREVYAHRPLISYRALTTSDRYLHGAGIFIRDVLLHFDLPQLAEAIPGRVTLISPVDHMERPVELSVARAQYPGRVQITGGTFELD